MVSITDASDTENVRAYTESRSWRFTKDIDFITTRKDLAALRGVFELLKYGFVQTEFGVKTLTKCKSLITFYPLPKDDPERRCPDTSRLERLVKWKPNVSFEEGLKRMIAWFLQDK